MLPDAIEDDVCTVEEYEVVDKPSSTNDKDGEEIGRLMASVVEEVVVLATLLVVLVAPVVGLLDAGEDVACVVDVEVLDVVDEVEKMSGIERSIEALLVIELLNTIEDEGLVCIVDVVLAESDEDDDTMSGIEGTSVGESTIRAKDVEEEKLEAGLVVSEELTDVVRTLVLRK